MLLKFEDLVDEYGDLVQAVSASTSEFFEDNLTRLLDFIETQQPFADVAKELLSTVAFEEWYQSARETFLSMVGSAKLTWPKERDAKLGTQLALAKHLSKNEEFMDFYHNFLGGSTRYDDMVSDISSQIVEPMARDLERIVRRRHQFLSLDSDIAYPPVSDRILALNRDGDSYRDAVDQLSRLVREFRESNSLGADGEERERVLCELQAGQSLLQSGTVRLSAVYSVLGQSLRWVANAAGEAAVGQLAVHVWVLLKKAIGI